MNDIALQDTCFFVHCIYDEIILHLIPNQHTSIRGGVCTRFAGPIYHLQITTQDAKLISVLLGTHVYDIL